MLKDKLAGLVHTFAYFIPVKGAGKDGIYDE